MKRVIFIGTLLIVLILSGCNGSVTKSTIEDKSPNVIVEVDGEEHKAILGSYCWEISSQGETATVECVDTVGPVDLLEGEEPIKIMVGEQITLKVDYTPQPNRIHLTEIKNGVETEIEIKNDQFIAPDEKGIYFYSYGLWWIDEEVEIISNNDAFYAFAIEVK